MFDRIPELLRRLRLDQELTQAELAKKAELSESQLSRLEGGLQAPQLDTLGRLLEALEVTFEDFCRLYGSLRRELDPDSAEGSTPEEERAARQAEANFVAGVRPLLEELPGDLNGAQLDFPHYVLYIMPKPREQERRSGPAEPG